jgi:hypothetical protein
MIKEIPPAPKQRCRYPRKSVAIVVKDKDDEDVPSKNWVDGEVHTLIAICGKIEVKFLKNAK